MGFSTKELNQGKLNTLYLYMQEEGTENDFLFFLKANKPVHEYIHTEYYPSDNSSKLMKTVHSAFSDSSVNLYVDDYVMTYHTILNELCLDENKITTANIHTIDSTLAKTLVLVKTCNCMKKHKYCVMSILNRNLCTKCKQPKLTPYIKDGHFIVINNPSNENLDKKEYAGVILNKIASYGGLVLCKCTSVKK